jgi:cation:H+ antiporter
MAFLSVLLILLGFTFLVVGGKFLVRSSVALSFRFQISKMAIGLTVVSFATSFPELIVSLNAALSGVPDIAINNVIGSNIANIGLILGLTILLRPLNVKRSFYNFSWPAMLVFSFLLYSFLHNDKKLSFSEGILLLLALSIFLVLLLKLAKRGVLVEKIVLDDSYQFVSSFKIIVWLSIGSVALFYGSKWLVLGAVSLAKLLDVSEAVISVTMIAVGTSIPELAASLIAIAKNEKSLSLGNLIGSNIFNIGSVLGLTAVFKEIAVVDLNILERDILWMLAFAALIFPLALIPKRSEFKQIKGLFLLVLYGIFIYNVLQ